MRYWFIGLFFLFRIRLKLCAFLNWFLTPSWLSLFCTSPSPSHTHVHWSMLMTLLWDYMDPLQLCRERPWDRKNEMDMGLKLVLFIDVLYLIWYARQRCLPLHLTIAFGDEIITDQYQARSSKRRSLLQSWETLIFTVPQVSCKVSRFLNKMAFLSTKFEDCYFQ